MYLDPEKPYNQLPQLPPESRFFDTVELWKLEATARSALAELKGLSHIMPNKAILINAIVLQEAKDSSEIENVITTQDKLYQALSMKSPHPDPNTKEVIKYREALFHGHKSISKKGIINISDIVKLQEILTIHTPGLRTMPGTELINEKSGKTIYTPPDGKEKIERLMKNLVEYINDSESSLIKMAIAHYQFESIHPFYDGNGRTGRLLNMLYLILHGYLDIPILYLSSYIINHKTRYYNLLYEVTNNANWFDWICFMLKGVEKTSKTTIAKIKAIQKLMEETIQIVRGKEPAIYSKELVELLFEQPYAKIEHITGKLGIERKAASRYLKKIGETGVLSLRKVGRENIYINKKLIELLQNPL